MSNHVKDKVIVVTGAASGFGRLVSEKTASLGAKVVCADINAAQLDAVTSAIVAAGGASRSRGHRRHAARTDERARAARGAALRPHRRAREQRGRHAARVLRRSRAGERGVGSLHRHQHQGRAQRHHRRARRDDRARPRAHRQSVVDLWELSGGGRRRVRREQGRGELSLGVVADGIARQDQSDHRETHRRAGHRSRQRASSTRRRSSASSATTRRVICRRCRHTRPASCRRNFQIRTTSSTTHSNRSSWPIRSCTRSISPGACRSATSRCARRATDTSSSRQLRMQKATVYSERLGAISDEQFHAVAERLRIGRFVLGRPDDQRSVRAERIRHHHRG